MNRSSIFIVLCISMMLVNSCSNMEKTIGKDIALSHSKRIKAAIKPGIKPCNPLPTTTNRCDVITVAQSQGMLIFGDIITPDGILKNGSVSITAQGKIDFVGCRNIPNDRTTINCRGKVISPGLINAHDHLKYNQTPPGGLGESKYAICNNPEVAFSNPDCQAYRSNRRNEWRKGLDNKYQFNAPSTKDDSVIAWNELRHIMAGTTTVAGSGGTHGLVRNPDVLNLMEGLLPTDNKFVSYNTFPLGDIQDVDGHLDNCAYPKEVDASVLQNLVFLPHVAEGIDAYAHNEFLCLSGRGNNPNSPGVDVVAANSAFIHSLAVQPDDAAVLKNATSSVVWSPRSNISLYGNTAPVTLFDQLGINLALSSDWTPSGSINLLRELQCASSFSQTYLANYFSNADLFKMVTENAAKALGLDDQIGQIKVGYWADLAVFSVVASAQSFISLRDIDSKDVVLTLRAGIPLYGDTDVINTLRLPSCESMDDVCGVKKSVCLAETGFNFTELKEKNKSSYQLALCGHQNLEPTCTPARYQEYSGAPTNTDADGDGVPDSSDNCPTMFNPPRPMDNGKQLMLCTSNQ